MHVIKRFFGPKSSLFVGYKYGVDAQIFSLKKKDGESPFQFFIRELPEDFIEAIDSALTVTEKTSHGFNVNSGGGTVIYGCFVRNFHVESLFDLRFSIGILNPEWEVLEFSVTGLTEANLKWLKRFFDSYFK